MAVKSRILSSAFKYFLRKRIIIRYKSYAATLLLVWLAVGFYRTNNYYVNFLRKDSQLVLLCGALLYTVVGFFWNTIKRRKEETGKSLMVLQVVRRFYFEAPKYLRYLGGVPRKSSLSISKEEKTAILFYIVKFIFLPIMINFLLGNLSVMISFVMLRNYVNIFSIHGFNKIIFPFVFALFLFVDTAYFAFGYTFELTSLKNKIRSVDPSVFGWFVALISYPPLSGITQSFFRWYPKDNQFFWNEQITFVFQIFILLLFSVYVWATISLGAKSSNLTNRGIVERGPYAFIRHPAYISKNLAWWITLIPIMSIPAFMSMFAWSFIYFLRAITEEKHLSLDPDYRIYVKKVRFRFIPGVW